jgi:dTDP-4-amino-4,6-dideoxygalactose transaminase
MVELGYNYRIPDIVCALGIEQLKRLDKNLLRRREIATRYTAAFRQIHGAIPPSVREQANPAWHLYPIRLDLERLTADRSQVFRALRAENIGVNVHYIPAHLHPYYRQRFGYHGGEFPIAEEAYERLISLPMFHGMQEQDVEDVIAAVHKVMRHYAR